MVTNMDKLVELTILGEPFGKQRPKSSFKNGFTRIYTPQKTIDYEHIIATEFNNKYGHIVFEKDEPIKVTIVMLFGLNKGDYGKKGLNKSGRDKLEQLYCTKKPDGDNCEKLLYDALNKSCFIDDSQVATCSWIKAYTTETPRIMIRLESAKKINHEDLINGNWKL